MLNIKTLLEYYESNQKDYPVKFKLIEDSIGMYTTLDDDPIAILQDGCYEVYPSKEVPYVFVNSLKDDAMAIQLDYDENDEKSILDAFVNCTYLKLYKLRNEIDKVLMIIEGKSN